MTENYHFKVVIRATIYLPVPEIELASSGFLTKCLTWLATMCKKDDIDPMYSFGIHRQMGDIRAYPYPFGD